MEFHLPRDEAQPLNICSVSTNNDHAHALKALETDDWDPSLGCLGGSDLVHLLP